MTFPSAKDALEKLEHLTDGQCCDTVRALVNRSNDQTRMTSIHQIELITNGGKKRPNCSIKLTQRGEDGEPKVVLGCEMPAGSGPLILKEPLQFNVRFAYRQFFRKKTLFCVVEY